MSFSHLHTYRLLFCISPVVVFVSLFRSRVCSLSVADLWLRSCRPPFLSRCECLFCLGLSFAFFKLFLTSRHHCRLVLSPCLSAALSHTPCGLFEGGVGAGPPRFFWWLRLFCASPPWVFFFSCPLFSRFLPPLPSPPFLVACPVHRIPAENNT